MLLTVAAAQDAQLIVHDSESTKAADALGVLAKLGVDEQRAYPLLEKISADGSAAVIQGTREQCEQVAALFEQIDMRTTVRDAPGKPPAAEKPAGLQGTDVEALDAGGFTEASRAGPVLAMFYAPWCGHCHKAMPELAKAAAKLRGAGVRVAAVDCDKSRQLCSSMGVKGYPTISFVHGSQRVTYNGPRSAVALTGFAVSNARVAAVKSAIGGAIRGARIMASKVLGRGHASAT